MDGPGDTLREVFEETLLEINGSNLTIYKNWGTPNMTSAQSRGIKKDKNIFEFPVNTSIEKDDVIQIEGSRSFWKAFDIDEEIKFGIPVNLKVRVIKIDNLGNEIRINAEGRAIFHGDIYGGVQLGGHGNTQNISISNTVNPDFQASISSLVELIKQSSINELDKEELVADLDRVNQLSTKEQTTEVIDRAQKKITIIKTALEVSDLALKFSPYLIPIAKFFGLDI
jgi:hypothetical protein